MMKKPKPKEMLKAYNYLLREERVLRELQSELEEQLFALQVEELNINATLLDLNTRKSKTNSPEKDSNSFKKDSISPDVKRRLRPRGAEEMSESNNAKGKPRTSNVKGKSPDNKKKSDPETALPKQQIAYKTRSRTRATETTLKSCKTKLEVLSLDVEDN